MFSRSSRIFGAGLVAVAALTATGGPVRADDGRTSPMRLPYELWFCPAGGAFGLPMVDSLVGQVLGCGGRTGPASTPAPATTVDQPGTTGQAVTLVQTP
ncbi:hypothetical protein Nocox_39080 [Nonomuraea coxensis DSM 45129]|uniref:Uncharacterized protein n=1 Tax=Nonomuraea coxensis DSM 45129 TaxID=1122611 RepID=A0ABX8UC48_9ACTN|nr:hypothetical protein [Nonomuraea coxensis]QYC45366.1 hypothetical protein Nocox_39080 [Nonomuraea coxensis DSM 45129]